ncbi:hypothetical protein O0I10_000106 [Lichtheimia ornata]|uniref:SRA1/Sec31 domain-containing protein n=1 Tax=Lichtheimia ornata TaxID=688661 RepID=A0AAD7Y4U1_9FUNG|nr:uncharacterized protein O0I10_000106 [Lichtheimia ornata]KAJ8663832.1 hypothetical protein O0I10_000106 [Lichtheimia ornata]
MAPSPTGPPPKGPPPKGPPPSTDFRNATIENHWNDPPDAIFKKREATATDDANNSNNHDRESIAQAMRSILSQCEPCFTAGPNKRIFQDTQGRINGMLDELDKNEIPDRVVQSLSEFSQALQDKDWEKSLEIHTRLMTTEYDKHGNWLIGLKRLVDLAQKASA